MKHHTFASGFLASSQVWIYQADRALTTQECTTLELEAQQFIHTWQRHGEPLHAAAAVFYNHFLVLCVDAQLMASGCSIDSSVRMVKALQEKHQLNFFNRLNIVTFLDGEPYLCNQEELIAKLAVKTITEDTLVFDNTVTSLGEFQQQWVKPLQQTWVNQLL